jgi:peptide/nickel transport system ATP-binding protein
MVEVEDLEVCFTKEDKQYLAVAGTSFKIESGEVLGIVGESGCGKSITSLSMMGLLPATASVLRGKLNINGHAITPMNEKNLMPLRGGKISMIFQEPMTALNPLVTVGKQIKEAYVLHHKVSKEVAYQKTLEMMRKVGLSRVEKLYKNYPHQLSGGMRQRIVIAMALINDPEVVIADEPTTALDVTIQAQILALLKKLNKEVGSSILFISHDLGVIKELCKRTLVMYAGYIVEDSLVSDIFKRPLHPYTKGLLDAIPTAAKKGLPLQSINGMVPSPFDRDNVSCCFKNRCTYAEDLCFKKNPDMRAFGDHKVRCHFVNKINGISGD